MSQMGEEAGIGIAHDGDHSLSPVLDEGDGEGIIAREDDEVLWEFARSDLLGLLGDMLTPTRPGTLYRTIGSGLRSARWAKCRYMPSCEGLL